MRPQTCALLLSSSVKDYGFIVGRKGRPIVLLPIINQTAIACYGCLHP